MSSGPKTITAESPLPELVLDEPSRPKAPKVEGVLPHQREQGRHLAAIHRMYLDELAAVGRALQEIEAGRSSGEQLSQTIGSLDLTRNFRSFGNLCGRECYVLTMHHNIEEAEIFPILQAKGNAGLRAVVERLQDEHRVVHALLEKLAAAAGHLVNDPGEDAFSDVRDIFRALVKVVASHFKYEETELEEALGVYNAL